MPTVSALDRKLWAWLRDLDLWEALQPENLAQARDAFRTALATGEDYNPVFQYSPGNYNCAQELRRCDEMRRLIETTEMPQVLMNEYDAIVAEAAEDISLFEARSKGDDIAEKLTSFFGEPEDELLGKASEILSREPIEPACEPLTDSSGLAKILGDTLAKLGLGWEIEIKDKCTSGIAVEPIHHRIRIAAGRTFTSDQVERYKVHEIATHVFRAENGALQQWGIFEHGFTNYLESEEGIACLAEERSGVLSPRILRRYAGRVLASRACCSKSFVDTFRCLEPHFDFDAAFSTTARVKRGLTDTSVPGGFTKDQVYLRGYLRMASMDRAAMVDLFHGKLGIQHLPMLESLKASGELVEPRFIPAWLLDGTNDAENTTKAC